jgi:hypothetical protein
MSAREPSRDGTSHPIGTSQEGHWELPAAPVASHAYRGLKFHFVGCVLLAALVGACGSTPVARPNLSPLPTSSASAEPSAPLPSTTANPTRTVNLSAVVETGANASQPGTVAIVGLDGYAKAKATFQPRVGPVVPDAYTPLQGVAQVVGTGVYYIDGAGTVRVLRVGSQPQVVARFPLQPAQEDIWFAVNPDGSHVVAGILTLPALGPNTPGTSWPTLVGPWKFDLEMAVTGGQTSTLIHSESAYAPDDQNHGWKPMFPIGWTAAGPVVMLPNNVTSQNVWTGGALYVIDGSGTKTTRLGGSDCTSAGISATGFIACTSAGSDAVAVRYATGTVLWPTHVSGAFAMNVQVYANGLEILNDLQVETRAGGRIQMPSGFLTQGWLDAGTVVGRVQYPTYQGNLSWIRLSDPTNVHDLGFEANFVAAMV